MLRTRWLHRCQCQVGCCDRGPPPNVSVELIHMALSKMKCGPSGMIAEMLKTKGEEGVELMRELAEAVFSSGMIPAKWEESIVLNLFKGKGVALDCSNYRGLKHTEQVMKLLVHVLDSCIHKMVNVDKMQHGFLPGRETTDAIFITCQLQVNMKRTEFLVSGIGLEVLKDSGKSPYIICRSGCGVNSILGSQCKLWVHKKCSDIMECLKADPRPGSPH